MKYGTKGAMWAPMTKEGDAKTKPTYGEVKEFDGINEFTETLNMASASAYGDNQEKLYISEFSSGEGTVKAVFIDAEVSAAILGTKKDAENGMAYGSEDNQPFGAYGFYRNLMDANKKKYYEVNWYPKVQGSVEGSTSKTKENGITLEYDSIKFRIQACGKGVFKVEKRFETESAAAEYLAGLFAGTSPWPGDTAGSGEAAGGGTVEGGS